MGGTCKTATRLEESCTSAATLSIAARRVSSGSSRSVFQGVGLAYSQVSISCVSSRNRTLPSENSTTLDPLSASSISTKSSLPSDVAAPPGAVEALLSELDPSGYRVIDDLAEHTIPLGLVGQCFKLCRCSNERVGTLAVDKRLQLGQPGPVQVDVPALGEGCAVTAGSLGDGDQAAGWRCPTVTGRQLSRHGS